MAYSCLNLCFQMRSNEMIQDDTPCWGSRGQGLRTESDCRAWIYMRTRIQECMSLWVQYSSKREQEYMRNCVQLCMSNFICATVFVHASLCNCICTRICMIADREYTWDAMRPKTAAPCFLLVSPSFPVGGKSLTIEKILGSKPSGSRQKRA